MRYPEYVFGLGIPEVVIIAAIALLIFGPKAIPKGLNALRSIQKAKSELTGPAALKHLLGDGTADALNDVKDSLLGKDEQDS